MHVVQVSNAGVYTTPQSCGASGLSKMLSSVGGFPHVVELGVQNGVDMPRSVGSHGGECEDFEGKDIFQNQDRCENLVWIVRRSGKGELALTGLE